MGHRKERAQQLLPVRRMEGGGQKADRKDTADEADVDNRREACRADPNPPNRDAAKHLGWRTANRLA